MNIPAVNHELTVLLHSITPGVTASWHYAVAVYQINAIRNLVYGGIALVLLPALGWLLWFTTIRTIQVGDRHLTIPARLGMDPERLPDLVALVVWVFMLAILILLAFGFSFDLLSVWDWVGAVHPQLYTVHKLLSQMTAAASHS